MAHKLSRPGPLVGYRIEQRLFCKIENREPIWLWQSTSLSDSRGNIVPRHAHARSGPGFFGIGCVAG